MKIFIHKHDTNRTVISYAYEFAGGKGDYTIYGEEGKNIMDRYEIYRIVHKNKYVT
ncbi:hypothetical protein CAMSH0001_1054 [Campylobacter showae RM3277]|uniref:Uncharacterized protein n=1 Tax=Campylobacter showae RM3277 TaxID=553219 RepID=C6RHV0_9BACT|nr:hypothetical protein CAMSH0001_1054 [Campylobacter showae RM3277]